MRAICRRIIVAISFLFLCVQFSNAQSDSAHQSARAIRLGSLGGWITDNQQGNPLQGATISAMDQASGLFLRHVLSNGEGRFLLKGIPVGRPIELRISYSGYVDTSAVFTVADTIKTLWTGKWVMQVLTKELEAVSITRRKPPFVVKKDTLEFDARQFKTLPGDMVKDLLRKLPGLQIDVNGGVTVNGKPVDRIKVDGRDFMGGNLQTVLDNIPGMIIDKVQVTDTREPETDNTTVVRKTAKSYTVNLTLKKENKIGKFGNTDIAKGSPGLGWATGFFNAMRGNKRLTVEAATSNVNPVMGGGTETEFVHRSSGAGDALYGGIRRNSWGAGAEFLTNLGPKGSLNIHYLTPHNRSYQRTITERQNFLPDSSFLYNDDQHTEHDEHMHSMSVGIVIPIDSLQTLRIIPAARITSRLDVTDQQSLTSTMDKAPINRQQNFRREPGKDYLFMNRVMYSLTSRDKLTHLTVMSQQAWTKINGEQEVIATNTFYRGGDSTRTRLAQKAAISGNGFNGDLDATLKRDLSKRVSALAKYTALYSTDNNNKDVRHFDSVAGKYIIPDTLYSTVFKNTAISHSAAIGIGYTDDKLTAELNAGITILHRINKQLNKANEVDVRQKNFTPTLNMAYQLSKYGRQELSYSFTTIAPSSEQIAPVPDNSNPLIIKLGNPGLKTGISHMFSTGFSYYNPSAGVMLNSSVGGALVKNAIVPDNFYDTLGRQVMSFRNVDETRRMQGGGGFTWMRMRAQYRLTTGISWTVLYDENKGFINRQENTSRNLELDPAATVSFSYKEKIELSAEGARQFVRVRYSLPGISGTDYSITRLNGTLVYMPFKGMKLATQILYSYNSMIPAGFPASSTLWNARADYTFLKDQRMTVYCLLSDVLNKSNNLQRIVTPTELTTSGSAILRRCVLVGVKFRFSKFEQPGL